ncbi:MAG: hypothetical protein NDJ92_08915 [Thermoanaerobaculia bacterium]|nr:hypothetical protein [Thermoanaerobaculia bacterium]
MKTLFAEVGIEALVALSLMAVAGAAWFIAVAVSIVSRKPQPKTGHRGTDTVAVLASIGFALSVAFAVRAVTAPKKPSPEEDAAIQASKQQGTCANLSLGMKAGEVRRLMGEPDELRSEEDVRGPDAEVWVYKTSRCSVHVLSGRVDFID